MDCEVVHSSAAIADSVLSNGLGNPDKLKSFYALQTSRKMPRQLRDSAMCAYLQSSLDQELAWDTTIKLGQFN